MVVTFLLVVGFLELFVFEVEGRHGTDGQTEPAIERTPRTGLGLSVNRISYCVESTTCACVCLQTQCMEENCIPMSIIDKCRNVT